MKKAVGRGLAVLSALAAVVALAPAGQAAVDVRAPYKLVSSCAGSLVSGFPKVMTNRLGDTQGSVYLYYSSAGGGTNCATVYDNASGSHQMSVTLRRANLSYAGSDSGVYATYAGGVAVTGTAGTCVYVSGYLSMGPYSVDRFSYSAGPIACG
jgi:hypothetical protein